MLRGVNGTFTRLLFVDVVTTMLIEYPNLLVTTGLHDSQVQYWEPAKWVAKLRELKTDDKLLLMKTDMAAGHSGKTGRFHRIEDTALYFSFFLALEGIKE